MLSPDNLYNLLVIHDNPASSLASMVITRDNARTMFELAASHIEIACCGVTDPECASHWRAIEEIIEQWCEIGIIDTDLTADWSALDDWLEEKWSQLRTHADHIDAPIAYGVLFFRTLWLAYQQQLMAMRSAAEFTGGCPFPELIHHPGA